MALGLLAAAQIGCRAGQGTAYDYASPVAGNACVGHCGVGRCGSVHATASPVVSESTVVEGSMVYGDAVPGGVVIEEHEAPMPAPPEGI